MEMIGIAIAVAMVVGLVWISALVVGAKSRSLGTCFLSLFVNGAFTYGVRLVFPELFISALITIPFSGFVNSKLFETSFIKGLLISIFSGLLLAAFIIYRQS